jgi:aryl-alcohol dehydrogenase-like predicted oxidoreductase
MKYNPYLKYTPAVSEIGFGAWQLGAGTIARGLSEKEALTMVRKAIEWGVNFFDTAPNYGLGTSESRLGEALKDFDRTKIVINTKFGHTVSGGLNYSADYIRESLEGSLKRLKMDYVDSLIIHNPPFEILNGNKSDHFEELERLKEEGKIKGYGASVDTYDEMKILMETTDSQVIETFFNILHQDTARAFDLAQRKNVRLIGKIPLDSGWLSGKYTVETTFSDIRERWSREDIQTRATLVHRIKEILDQEHELGQMALAFCLSYDAITTVIPGNSSLSQLENNVKASQISLSNALRAQLEKFYQEEVSHLNLPW